MNMIEVMPCSAASALCSGRGILRRQARILLAIFFLALVLSSMRRAAIVWSGNWISMSLRWFHHSSESDGWHSSSVDGFT
jgi:hypothetical protein